MSKTKNTANIFPILPLIIKRWSSRSFDETKIISQEEMNSLLEAARWSPSAYNDQPWRFLIANRGDSKFNIITETLVEFNQLWASKASAFMVVAGNTKRDDGSPNYSYAFDCGQAVAFLSLEATNRDIILHQMGGFDKIMLKQNLEIHEDLDVLVVIALGYYQNDDHLVEPIKSLELTQRTRKSHDEILF